MPAPMTDTEARLSIIKTMISGYPASSSGISKETPTAFLLLLTDIPTTVVGQACRSIMQDRPPRTFAPSASELYDRCLMIMPSVPDPTDNRDMRQLVVYPQGGKPPPGTLPAGLLSVNFDGRRIDLSHVPVSEHEEILRSKGRNRLAGHAGKLPAVQGRRM